MATGFGNWQKDHWMPNIKKASLWEPQAREVRNSARSLSIDIGSLRSDTTSRKDSSIKKLYNELIAFKKKCLQVDEDVQKALEAEAIVINNDYIGLQAENEFIHYMADLPVISYLAGLSALENKVVRFENFVVTYCEMISGSISDDFSEKFPILINQNTKHLKGGEQLEINAGVGYFSMSSAPHITIDGKYIPITERAVAEYKLIAPNVPGKHFVPIKILYTEPDGLKKAFDYNLEYFVDP